MDEKASGNLGKVEAVGRKITTNVTIAKYEMKDNNPQENDCFPVG